MTLEEAIENLRYMISDECTETQVDFAEEIDIAIEALEKQIPKKPVNKYSCPCCGEKAGIGGYICDYCPYCGQALDWRKTE